MQSYLASSFVGQTVKLSLGKTTTLARVAFIDTPSTRAPDYISLKTRHGVSSTVHSYWPGASHPRLHLDHFPRTGPLSHPHYLLKRHREASHHHKHGHHEFPLKHDPESSSVQPASKTPPESIEPQYITTERGELLSLSEYGEYHEARLKGATVVFQCPNHYSVPVMRRAALESLNPVIAAESEMRVISSTNKAIIAEYGASNLKPQKRSILQRVFQASSNMIRNTLPTLPNNSPYVHPNDRLLNLIETHFGLSRFSTEDVLSLQRSLRDETLSLRSDSLRPKLRQSPPGFNEEETQLPLTEEDVELYEITMDGIRDALEHRWTHFCPAPADSLGSNAPHLFRLWPVHSRPFLHLLSFYLQPKCKEDLFAFTEKLKPLLKFQKKANPLARPRNGDQPEANSSQNKESTQIYEPTDATSSPNEEWPTVFDESIISTLPTKPEHLFRLQLDDELEQVVILGLALLASSSFTHPIPKPVSQILSNFILQPLGYPTNALGAQLLLTHLGLPITDPIDIPFIVKVPDLDDSEGPLPITLLKSYPWLSSAYSQPMTLHQFVQHIHGDIDDPQFGKLVQQNLPPVPLQTASSIDSSEQKRQKAASQPHITTLYEYSSRHNSTPAMQNLTADMAVQASSILKRSVDESAELANLHTSSDTSPVTQYILDLIEASKIPTFQFSKHGSPPVSHSNPNLPSPSFIIPSILSDSSQLVKPVDPDFSTRVDLSHLPSFAVDDASTTEVDDAFALDIGPLLPYADWILNYNYGNGVETTPPPAAMPKTARVYIHIADPSAVMTVGDALEAGARTRVETMYLPQRKSFMLPTVLSEFYCSLQPGDHVNVGLTFEAHIDLLTGALESTEVFPSKFRNMRRYTYEAVQDLILGQNDRSGDALSLKILHKLSESRKHWRIGVGKAATLHLPRKHVKVVYGQNGKASTHNNKLNGDGGDAGSRYSTMDGTHENLIGNEKARLVLYEDGNKKSRSLVEEMMVLVGEIAGRTATTHGIPVPFRIQPWRSHVVLHEASLELQHAKSDPYDPTLSSIRECEVTRQVLVHSLQNLNLMATSSTSSSAAVHASLGLSSYARASSPLRRYADLVTHLQLKAWRRHGGDLSKLPFSNAQMQLLCHHIHTVSKDIKYTQQQSERWWKQQYVLRHGMDRTWEAIVFASPDYSLVSIGLSRPQSRVVFYSFFILELDLMVFLPTPNPLQVGSLVCLKPLASSLLHLDWSVLPTHTVL